MLTLRTLSVVALSTFVFTAAPAFAQDAMAPAPMASDTMAPAPMVPDAMAPMMSDADLTACLEKASSLADAAAQTTATEECHTAHNAMAPDAMAPEAMAPGTMAPAQ